MVCTSRARKNQTKMTQTLESVRQVLSRVTFPGLIIDAHGDAGRLYLQVENTGGQNNITGEHYSWKGRKWRLSPHMTDSEIVQTALKAVLTAYEHEIRELFKYRDVPIFDPHYDVEKLVELRSQPGAISERKVVI